MNNKLFLLLLSLLGTAVARKEWWPTIKAEYEGSSPPTRKCGKKMDAPQNATACGKNAKQCFFGSQTCADGSYPNEKCACDGNGSARGMWTCVEVPCPAVEEPEDIVDPIPTATLFRSSGSAAFPVEMNLLTSDVLNGYSTVEEICADLNQTVRFYVNSYIDQQSRYNPYEETLFPISIGIEDVAFSTVEFSADSSVAISSPSAEGATDFETNNQEEGVDEADMVKSDGTYVYAVYGDVVSVWDANTGDAVSNYTLPPLAGTSTSGGGGGFSGGGEFLVVDSPIFNYKPKPNIRGMSLDAGKLVLYVQGYGAEVRAATKKTSVFSNAYDTRIVVLDTATLPASLDALSTLDVHGTYRDAREINANIHVVTTSNINYYNLQNPLRRWNSAFEGLNNTDYIATAAAIAAPMIDDFVKSLCDDVIKLGVPNIPKISIWQSDLGNNTNIVEDIYKEGAIRAFAQITSFSVAGLTAGPLTVKTSGAFTPSSWGYTYAVDGNLVFAAQGYNWSPWFGGGSTQTTYLLGFDLDGITATPSFLGSVPGYINNQYYLNIHEGHMSVATTVTQFWPVWTQTEDSVGNIIWPQPRFETKNSVFVFKLPTVAEPDLKEVGRVTDLGLPGERFTAVRFFGNICYAVTFRQTDPFYVVSTDPTNIALLGELKVTGFSSYLHSLNADDTLLVGVGQEADSTGRVLGIQISLFDATNATAPALLSRLVVEQETNVWSSSTVQWDYKAFRYLPLGADFGIVIIPLQVRAWNQIEGAEDANFDGFMAYDVSATNGISQRLNVTHVQSQDFYSCYYRANLPQRSLVFNGNLTTMKGHSVISTDLDTGEKQWQLDMAKPAQKEECVYWFW